MLYSSDRNSNEVCNERRLNEILDGTDNSCSKQQQQTLEQELTSNRSFKSIGRNLEAFTLIWYCNTNKTLSEEDQQVQMKLRQSINYLIIVNNTDQCIDLIEKIQNEKIILILSHTTATEILPKVHNLQQIITIYIYNYSNNTNDQNWTEIFNKVNAVINESDDLIQRIAQEQINHNKNDRELPTTIFSPIHSNKNSAKEKSHYKLDGNLLWSKLFIEALIRLKHEDMQTSLDELIDLLYEQYKENDIQCAKIEQFKRSYKSSDAIMWYTKEPFIYQLLNKALRMQDIDTIFAFRFLIHDINQQLSDEQLEYCIRLEQQEEFSLDKIFYTYRGQSISIEEFENFQNSKGQYVSINTFFSTSKSKQVGLVFTQSNQNNNPSKISILFEVESDIDTPILTRPFADIHHLSQFDVEEEVLFMIGTVFKIVDVYYDNIWIIKLILCDEKDQELNGIFQKLTNEFLSEETNLMSIGNVLFEMGCFDKVERFYRQYFKSLSEENFREIGYVYEKLAILADATGDHHLSLIYMKTRFDMVVKMIPNLDSSKVELLDSLYDRLCDRDKPVEFDKVYEVLQTQYLTNLETVGHDHLDTASIYEQISHILRTQGRLDESLKHCQECLNIQLKLLPNNHPKLAKTYETMGDLHVLRKDYEPGFNSYQIVLTIKLKSFPNNHPEIARLYLKIGRIYGDCLDNYQLALKNYNMALGIYLQTFPSTHSCIKEIKDLIEELMVKQNSM